MSENDNKNGVEEGVDVPTWVYVLLAVSVLSLVFGFLAVVAEY